MERAVWVKGLRFRYQRGKGFALEGIDFEQRKGEVVAIVGRSGAGKSSFLLCLNRIVPDFHTGEFSGEVEILGETISGKKTYQLARKLGLVLQDFESQLFSTKAELDIAFGPENLGIGREEMGRRIDCALSAVGMSEFRERAPETLSGGEKQRLAIASVLALEPEVLAFDEACTDLDPMGRAEVFELMKKLKAEGKTILLVEHEPEGLFLADRIVILNQGKIIAEGSKKEILSEPELLIKNGVRPSEMAELCGALKITPVEFDPIKVGQIVKERGFRLKAEVLAEIRKRDEGVKNQPGEVIIKVEGLEHIYPNGKKALSGIELEVRRNDFLAIIGQNGSGKTTLVKHFNGLLKGSKGLVSFLGKEILPKMVSELGREIGFVFQNPDHQIFSNRVYDEVGFGPRNYGFSEAEVKKRVEVALELVGLSGREDENPFLMTKGERQRLAIASVLSAEPGVLILDEPTTGLDYTEQIRVMELLKELNQKGRTIIIITHTLWLVARYASQAVVLAEGKKILEGSVREVLAQAEILKQADLIAPEITRFGMELGFPFLRVDEALKALGKKLGD